MKQLIFIDNDSNDISLKELKTLKINMDYSYKVPVELIDNIRVVSDFRDLDRDAIYDMILDHGNIICSWSMYTATHFNSLGQLFAILRGVGRNHGVDLVYIDFAGTLFDALNRNIMNLNPKVDTNINILKAVECNKILTISKDNNPRLMRIRVNLGPRVEYGIFELQDIELGEIWG